MGGRRSGVGKRMLTRHGGPKKWSGQKNVDAVAIFKFLNDPELALVSSVSPDRLMMGHVEKAHSFERHELAIGSVIELAASHRPDRAGLTDESPPFCNGD